MSPRVAALLGLFWAGACGGPSVAVSAAPTVPGGPGLDPPPALPAAHEDRAPGAERTALRLSDGEDEAREVATRLLRAVLDGDRPSLEALVDEPVGRCQPHLGPADRARAPVLDAVLHTPTRSGNEASLDLDTLISRSRITVSTLRAYLGSADPPEGLSPGDLVVRLPLTPTGSQVFHALLPGWLGEGVIVVRPGREHPVVGL